MLAKVKPEAAAAIARLLLAHGALANAQEKVNCLFSRQLVQLVIKLMCFSV